MTEERMIRVEFEDKDRATICNKHTDQMYVYYDETEPVPSKDFKPKCWYEHFSYHVEDENGPQMIDVYDCGICDIRDKCIYKRE